MNPKVLGILAYVLAAVAIAASLYAVIETLPNYKATNDRIVSDGSAIMARLLESYRGTMKQLAYVAAGSGAVAAILGLVASKRGWKPGLVAAVLGLAAFGAQFAWAV